MNLSELTAGKLLALVGTGEVPVAAVAEAVLERAAAREPVLHAFAALEPDLVRARAAELDATDRSAALHGLPVAVKDLVDTADLPTSYGSAIYAGHRPAADAAIVRRLRGAGALLLGKTVTTEFALFEPGPTTNPSAPGRTPGGSSSGSAAAVADGVVPAAVGTQTAGSVVRPAAFCGVVGFKPSFGGIDRTGVKLISETLDTVGLFTRTVADARAVFGAVRADGGHAAAPSAPGGAVRLGLVRTAHWHRAEPSTREGIERLARDLAGRDLTMADVDLTADYDGLAEAQTVVMEVEAAANLAREVSDFPDRVSTSVLGVVERGRARSRDEYADALALAAGCRERLPELLTGVDAVLTPAVLGEAPVGLGSTGDPLFCRAWTLLHCPALSLPLLRGPNGFPVGVQLVAPAGADDRLLDAAERVARAAAGEATAG